MRTLALMLVAGLGWVGWKVWSFVQSGRTERERAVAQRGVLTFALLGFLALVGFVFTPMPFKLLLVIPVFLVTGSVAKAFRDVRARLRDEAEGRGKVERMKRIN